MRPRMHNRSIRLAGMVLAAAIAFAGPALAQRALTADERSAIETTLRQQGFTSWEEIELDDDDRVTVFGARAIDGVAYDLELDADSLEIVESTQADDEDD
jgi:hypothetical protein